jgi:very-short-patch-repair endonuclease
VARPKADPETDGYRFHRGRLTFEDDHARDIELKLRWYEVIRLTYRQVVDEPGRVAHMVRALLG